MRRRSVTPFKKDGSIDDECFQKLVERQIKGGVKLLVPCGTTGENVTMSSAEQAHVIKLTVEVAKKHGAKVIAGTGTNNTAAAIEHTRKAREAGADAALIVAPYYNKPTQEGMFRGLLRDREIGEGFSDRALQRAFENGVKYFRGDDAAFGRKTRKYCRDKRSVWKLFPGDGDPKEPSKKFPRLFRRRRLDAAVDRSRSRRPGLGLCE